MLMPEVRLRDMSIHIPLITIVIGSLLIFSMGEQIFWMLFLPLGICFFSLYLLYYPSYFLPLVDYRMKEIVIKDIILTISIIVMILCLRLDPDAEKTYQIVLRGLAIFLMSCLSLMICFLSVIHNVPMEIFAVVLLVFSFIVSFIWISMENPVMRRSLSIVSLCLFIFFLLYHMASLTMVEKKKKQIQHQFGFDVRPLEKIL